MRPLARQVPKRDARVILLPLPAPEQVPPLILRLITRWRRLRSAALLSGGVSGWETKTNNSLMCRSIWRRSFPWTASGSSKKARHSPSNRLSSVNCSREEQPTPPPQEAPLRGRAGSPNAAIDPVLTPAGLISVHCRTRADTLQDFIDGRSGLLGCLLDGPDDGPNAQLQLVDRSQIPLDCPYRQPPLFPQGDDQTDRIDPKPLPAHGNALQRLPGQPPFPAQGTGPGYEYVLRDFRRDYRNVYDFPGPLDPTPAQGSMAFGARLRGVDHPPGGFHPRPGEAVLTLLSRLLLLLRRLLAPGGRFMPRHPGPSPPPDSRASRLSTRWRSSEMTPCCSAMIASRVPRLACFRSNSGPIVLLCHNCAPTAGGFIMTAAFGKFTSSTLNCYNAGHAVANISQTLYC